jgi:hypothetical protein
MSREAIYWGIGESIGGISSREAVWGVDGRRFYIIVIDFVVTRVCGEVCIIGMTEIVGVTGISGIVANN